ncbi:MAG: choice-of-anchor D domain-containing protein, partial [Prosthecobacter sp.]
FVISNTGTATLNLSGWTLLNPATGVSANGPTTLGSSSVVLNSTLNLTPGMVVSGGPFAAGTTLVSISGNTATFSSAATSTTPVSVFTFYPAGTSLVNAFAFSGALPTSVAAGATATVTVNFVPNSTAAGTYTRLLRFTTNDSNENPYQLLLTGTAEGVPLPPEVALSVAGTAVAQNGSIAYGSTTVGTPVSKVITISNTGGQTLTLSSFSFVTSTTGINLPTTAMMGSTTATVASTTGLSAGMSVVGTGIPAGTTIVSVNSATSITLSAPATSMLMNSSVTYLPAGGTVNPFSITTSAASSVPGGGSTSVTVRYNPTAAGTHNVQLRFTTNDSDENPAQVTLTGTATP